MRIATCQYAVCGNVFEDYKRITDAIGEWIILL